MTDFYQTKTARKVAFTARPVIGGVFMQMLYQKPVWQKYAHRDKIKAVNWAPLPTPTNTLVRVASVAMQASGWPDVANSKGKVHYLIADTNGLVATAIQQEWQPSLFLASGGDQEYEVRCVNITNGLSCFRATDNFLNIADTNFTAWADTPVMDVLLQVLGDDKLYDDDGNGREIMFRIGTLGHEKLVSVGAVPSGNDNGRWHWLLFSIPNDINSDTGKRFLGNVPDPDAPGGGYGGVNGGTLRIENVAGITLRAIAIGPPGTFSVAN